MKITTIIFLLSTLLVSCKELDELLTFTITDQVGFTIESTSPLDLPLNIPTPDVTTNSQQKFENNNTTAALVKDIRMDNLTLTITDPTGKTFSFLKSIHLYISTNNSDEIELAYHDNVPADVSTVALITTSEKLDAYVKSSSYRLRTSVVTREALGEPVDVQADLKFKVTANAAD